MAVRIHSVVVKIAPAETKTLSRLESMEVQTRPRHWEFEGKTKKQNSNK